MDTGRGERVPSTGAEANKMQIPVIAILDTDCDPDVVDVAIPGNDDAMRSVHLLLDTLGDSVEEGGRAWAVIEAERQKIEEAARREEEQRREQDRQRRQVTEDWQRKLREDAERKRQGGDEPPAADAPSA